MKKFLGVVIAAVMLAGGLVTFAMSPASAACPYSGCVPTYTFIDNPNKVKRGQKAKICVRVGSDGNGRPVGSVSIRVVRSTGGFRYLDNKKYNDWKECFTTPKLKKRGKYVIRARFDRNPNSRWQDSGTVSNFRVVRR